MSYADSQIDWRSVHIACLSGRNGAGKSAILDAVTWALWEGGRGSSDELIRLGQSEMWVDVRFSLDDQEYRVRRSRSRNSPRPGGKLLSKGSLELQMLQKGDAPKAPVQGINPMRGDSRRQSRQGQTNSGGDSHGDLQPTVAVQQETANSDFIHSITIIPEPPLDERWVSLTAPSMRETQARICQLLHMQYDTFINSVYLRQGRADEFTQKSAGDRKEVLGEILGLRYFDRMQDLAREEARTRKARIEQLQSAMPDLLNLEKQRAALTSELTTVTAATEAVLEESRETKEAVGEARAQLDESRQSAKMLVVSTDRLSELKADLESLQAQHQDLSGRCARFEKLLSKGAHLDAEQTRFSRLSEEVQALDKAALAVHDLLDGRQRLRSALAEARGRMEVELDHMREQVTEVAAKAKKLKRDTKERQKIEDAYHQYKRLLAEEVLLNRQQELHASLLNRAELLQSAIAEARMRLENDVENKEFLLEELKVLVESKATLESEHKLLLVQARDLDRVDAEFSLVEEKGLRIKSEIESLQSEVRELRRRCQENDEKRAELQYQPHSSTCPLCASPIVDRAAVTKRYIDQNESFNHEIRDLENSIARFEDERAELRTQYTELRKLLIARKSMDQKIGEYNERHAAIQRAELTFASTQAGLQRLRDRLALQEYAQVERESLINVKAELHKIEFDPVIYSNVQTQIRSQRHAEIRYHQMQKDLQALHEVEQQLPLLEQKIAEYSQQLRDDTYAPELRAQLNLIAASIAEHDYDQAKHSLVREQIAELMPIVEQFRELATARNELPSIKTKLIDIGAVTSTKQSQSSQLTDHIAELKATASTEHLCAERLDLLTEKMRASEQEHQALLQSRGSLVAKIEHLEQQMGTMQGKQGELQTLIDEMNDFNQLAEAFGKKGIQALVIENAIPELESEANRILSRLTDNQMHVGLITQQRSKQGNTIETLDIVIADEIGTRQYELFSGGEAFKVNFALRLALSRLLARRSGAKLETLIIDEGFGTQDEDSRHRLLNSINMVSDDFARIIVVSHIAEVKEMFPTQVLVTKEGGVSSAQVIN